MVKVGILGIGFMGTAHFKAYTAYRKAKVVALSDLNPKRLSGDWSDIAGNIEGSQAAGADLSKIHLHARPADMFADPDVDAVDITLPTFLHAKYTVAALKAGKHVICEKPMALSSAQCRKMIDAARKARKRLFVGHCIRFWPEYEAMREIIRGKKHGRVLSAVFTRLSGLPTWSYQGWLLDGKRSGGAALDLHIHDADFILHLFGKPRSVASRGSGLRAGQFDHIVTCYEYAANRVVCAEGAWDYPPTFPFSMGFRVVMDKATLALQPEGLMLYPVKGQPKAVKVAAGDGYQRELRHYVDCIEKNRKSDVLTPESAMQSVKLIEAEIKSAQTGRAVKLAL